MRPNPVPHVAEEASLRTLINDGLFTKRTLWFAVLLYCTTAVCEALKLLIFGAKIGTEKNRKFGMRELR